MFMIELETIATVHTHTHTHTHTCNVKSDVEHILLTPKIRRPNIIELGGGLDRPDIYQIQ